MKNILYILFFLLCGIYPVYASADIVLTEVEYNPSGPEAEAEWFELFNPTSSSVSLDNWTIQEGAGPYYEFSGVTLAPGEYLLVGNDQVGFSVEHFTLTLDIDMDGSGCYSDTDCLRLNNSGSDSLTLRNGSIMSGVIIDQVIWGSGGYASAGNGRSVCRITSIDTDSADDWQDDCTPSAGSGDYDYEKPVVKKNNSRSKKRVSIRWVCKNPQADNYTNTRFGRHRESQCVFSRKIFLDNFLRCNVLAVTERPYQSQSNEIMFVQQCLNNYGFDSGKEDGIYGPITRNAILAYLEASL